MLKSAIAVTLVVLAGLSCWAQDTETKKADTKSFYQLTYVLKELDGDRVVNTRSYNAITSVGDFQKIRASQRIPFASGPSTNVVDVGVSIDSSKLENLGNRVVLLVRADISSLAPGEKTAAGNLPPVTRNNQWEGFVVLPFKQPTIIFSSDDPASTRRMELQLTVMPVR